MTIPAPCSPLSPVCELGLRGGLAKGRKTCYTRGMKIALVLLACLPLCLAEESWSALLPDGSAGVTLDEEAFETIRAEMKAGQRPEADADVTLWRSAMNAASPEERDARLMALVLRLNPALSLEASLTDLVALLQLHSRALAGQTAACAELAQALYRGQWKGLKWPQDGESADKLSARAAQW